MPEGCLKHPLPNFSRELCAVCSLLSETEQILAECNVDLTAVRRAHSTAHRADVYSKRLVPMQAARSFLPIEVLVYILRT